MLQVLLDQTEVLVPFVGRARTSLTWVTRHAPRNIFIYTNMREERDCKIYESLEEREDLRLGITYLINSLRAVALCRRIL